METTGIRRPRHTLRRISKGPYYYHDMIMIMIVLPSPAIAQGHTGLFLPGAGDTFPWYLVGFILGILGWVYPGFFLFYFPGFSWRFESPLCM